MDNYQLAQSRGYAVSLVRWDAEWDPRGNPRRIPENVVPDDYQEGRRKQGSPFVVLWRTGEKSGFQKDQDFVKLAWYELPEYTLKRNEDPPADNLPKDWISILVRVREIQTESGKYDRIAVMYADPDNYERVRDGEQIIWPPNNIEADPSPFNLITWDHIESGTELCPQGYYVCDSTFGGFNSDHDFELGLHGFGQNLDNKLWFDDFAVRLSRTGGDGRYIPSYRE